MLASPSKSFVIFASGQGSNAEVLIQAAKARGYSVACLISDREAPAIEMASRHGVPTKIIPAKNEETLLACLRDLKPSWAFLAGYKKILGAKVLEYFYDSQNKFSRIINIHPSLLPAYPGLNGYERAFADGVRLSGVTVHLVDAGLDTGLPLLQSAFAREESDSLESFMAKGKALEHSLYPEALALAMENKIKFKTGSRWLSLEEK